MTPKEQSAMQQALDALHNYENTLMFLVPSYENKMRQATLAGGSRAIATLRGALAEPELNLNCKSVQARLATLWGYVKAEQAEQEPVACPHGVDDGACKECYMEQSE